MCEDNINPDVIDQKLSILPDKIGKYGRRFILIDDNRRNPAGKHRYILQYTTKGCILGEVDSRDNDILYYIEAESVDKVISKAKTVVEIDERINSQYRHSEDYVYIEEGVFDQGVSRINFISAYGQGSLSIEKSFKSESFTHILFFVQSLDYLLVFGRKGNKYFIQKNEHILAVDIPESFEKKKARIVLRWGIDILALSGSDELKVLQTPLLPPPNTLYDWARKKLLTSPPSYTRAPKIYNIVNHALENINEEISRNGDVSSFWDKQKIEKKYTNSIPKYEPDITQQIESRLRDIAYINNLDITRESRRGNGQIDLVFSGALNNGKIVKICVEVKKAHANDLVHGMTVQLPEYMRRVSTNYGIYCILYFGRDYQPVKSQFKNIDLSKIDDTYNILHNLLEPLLPQSESIKIRPIIIDVSQKKNPSKM